MSNPAAQRGRSAGPLPGSRPTLGVTADGPGALPNLLIIGAQKAGTTMLHTLLDAQPGVAMSAEKELEFFSSEEGPWRRGVAWYRSQFDPTAAIRGESSPSYTAYPFAREVPERIASVLDDIRFVYLVRDPVDRALSAMAHAIGSGYERRHPSELCDDPALEGTGYVALSRYAMQLELYRDVFGADAVLVVPFEELITNPKAVVERVLRHQGHAVKAGPVGEFAANPGADFPLRRWLRRALPERAARRLMRVRAMRRLDHRLMGPAPAIEISEAQRERLSYLLEPDAQRLRELTGLELAGWSI